MNKKEMSNISNTRFKGINRCFAPCIPKHNPTYNFTSECSSSQKDCVNMKIWTYMNKNRCHRTSEDSHLYPHMCAQHSKVYNMNTEWDKLNDRQKKLIVLMSKDITPAYLLMCLPEFMDRMVLNKVITEWKYSNDGGVFIEYTIDGNEHKTEL